MRPDGRRPDELRPVRFILNYTDYAEGSVLIEMGRTRVLCNASADEVVPAWLKGQGRGWITAEYSLLPRSTHKRSPRELMGPRGRTYEIQRLIGRSLRAAADLERLGERQIIVDCDVIQADGGTRTAAITGGYIAVALALKRLVRNGVLAASGLRMPVAAVSVGIVEGEPRLDLTYDEDANADVDFNVVMTASGEFIEIQGTAERRTFSRDMLYTLLSLAESGIRTLVAQQQTALRAVDEG
ncbi:MAG: ribonuclease PH [Chloroflexota bacterium]